MKIISTQSLCLNKEWFAKLMLNFLTSCTCNLKANHNLEKIILYKNFKNENTCLNEQTIFSSNPKSPSKAIVTQMLRFIPTICQIKNKYRYCRFLIIREVLISAKNCEKHFSEILKSRLYFFFERCKLKEIIIKIWCLQFYIFLIWCKTVKLQK